LEEHDSGFSNKDTVQRKEISFVESGAAGEYKHFAKEKLPYAYISGLFYTIGLGLITWIVISQTTKVIQAAWG
jgi:hypothetical protein